MNNIALIYSSETQRLRKITRKTTNKELCCRTRAVLLVQKAIPNQKLHVCKTLAPYTAYGQMGLGLSAGPRNTLFCIAIQHSDVSSILATDSFGLSGHPTESTPYKVSLCAMYC
jgi:hypothetical protein